MARPLDALQKALDVIEVHPFPQPEVGGHHPEGRYLPMGPGHEARSDGFIDDGLERLGRPADLLLQALQHVVFQRQCGPLCHIMKFINEPS